MANLLNQNIGTNYKGILNLNTLNGNLTSTLQAVTDGMGNASVLQLSTTQVGLNYSGNNTLLNLNTQASVAGGLRITYASSATEGLEFLYNSAGATISNINSIYASNSAELRFNMQTAAGGIRAMTIFGTGQIAINTTSASAQLQVRGDGTNPIARFENNSAVQVLGVNNNFITIGREGNIGANIYAFNSTPLTPDALGFGLAFASFKTNFNSNNYDVYFSGVDYTNTTGTANHVSIKRTFAAAAGAGNYRPFNIEYTLNNSGAQTGTATGIFLNATETALNGMGHNLLDLQVGGVSKFLVGTIHDAAFTFNKNADRFGLFTISRVGSPTTPALFIGTGSGPTATQGRIASNGDDLALGTVTGSTFTERLIITTSNLIALGGTTNAFPALKRNGAAIDFRLADDSGFCAVSATSFTIGGTATSLSANSLNLAGFNCMFYSSRIYIDNDNRGVAINNNLAVGGGNVATNASAALEVISTSKGFLPPRMTTTEKNAISTPASGLVVYDSTLNKLAVYTGSAWETVTSL